jgi:hypothetical protein
VISPYVYIMYFDQIHSLYYSFFTPPLLNSLSGFHYAIFLHIYIHTWMNFIYIKYLHHIHPPSPSPSPSCWFPHQIVPFYNHFIYYCYYCCYLGQVLHMGKNMQYVLSELGSSHSA